ncbi:PRC-barrel domain-containing protein [Bacillaceae bacterium S4-13-56]
MLQLASILENYNVQATDGELGKVKDLYFEKDTWVVRYLLVDTKKWLPGRKVLVSPVSFDFVDPAEATVNILETEERMKESPTINESDTITSKVEADLGRFFEWPLYWGGMNLWGSYATPRLWLESNENYELEPISNKDEEKIRVESVNDMKGAINGYRIQVKDGKIGHVSDVIVDDDNWEIKFLVIETRNFLPGDFVAISTKWIDEISWMDKEVKVDLEKDTIVNGPFFNPVEPINEEESLYHR